LLVASHKFYNFSDTMAIVLKCNTKNNQKCIKVVEETLKNFGKPYIMDFARLDLLEIIINEKNVLTKTFTAEEKHISKTMPIPSSSLQA